MIIWINGPFGVGKTQTAYELNYRIPNSIVVDPEEVGFFLQKQILPESRLPDFQDYPLWRKWVSELLHEAQNDRNRVVIVPMTVVSEAYFRQIINPLDDAGIVVQDFTLIARKETIERRLKKRFDGGSWNFRQIDRCLSGLESDVFSNKIDTDRMDLYQVVDCILNELPPEIDSIRKKSGRGARFIRRLRVFLAHIRIV
ncbi:AAA family ATPase [Cyanobium sp. N.Huapi 1H5]|uniref:AAA family ATPase n=1 Tax=Cyanobium sp. N.Huapi 1H5 TaxID=2823719 RepID=UPI0020CC0B78|nr:AAA family ATPase [Cyanobium sp. N.Huapi 1H5]MCP9836395.1 AAA family ATPase [Cyanobium sp. N.Huapi 1H5]